MTVTETHGSIACWAPAYDRADGWRDEAACLGVDTEVFFPLNTTGPLRLHVYDRARALCARCPVVDECLDEALRYRDDGFRAGMTAKQRDAERKARRIVMKPCRWCRTPFAGPAKFCSELCRSAAQ